jgi:hypothetical protein
MGCSHHPRHRPASPSHPFFVVVAACRRLAGLCAPPPAPPAPSTAAATPRLAILFLSGKRAHYTDTRTASAYPSSRQTGMHTPRTRKTKNSTQPRLRAPERRAPVQARHHRRCPPPTSFRLLSAPSVSVSFSPPPPALSITWSETFIKNPREHTHTPPRTHTQPHPFRRRAADAAPTPPTRRREQRENTTQPHRLLLLPPPQA